MNKKVWIFVPIAAAGLAAIWAFQLSAPATAEHKPQPAIMQEPTLEWALLPIGSQKNSEWKPSREEMIRIIAGIKDFVRQQAAGETHTLRRQQYDYILSHWNSYGCQAKGQVFPEGKTIVLSFLPKEDNPGWRTQEIHVMGGGAQYFKINYDAETRAFRSVWINAPR